MSLSDGFFLFYSWADLLDTLDGEDYKALLTAIIARQRYGTPFPAFSNKQLNTYAAIIEPIIQQRLYGQMGGYKAHTYPTIPPTIDPTIPPTIEPTGVKLSNVEYSNINNTTTTTRSLSGAQARTREHAQEDKAPSVIHIAQYFEDNTDMTKTQAVEEAHKFYAFNESYKWKCLPMWTVAADSWIKQINTRARS